MSTKFVEKVFRMVFVLVFVLGLAWTPGTSVKAGGPPTFASRLTENEVHGYGWTVGSSVTLTIDDPADGIGDVDYTATETVVVADWDPSQTFAPFRLGEDGFTLAPDQIVTMTDGVTTKIHTVTALTVTEVDPDADTVSGTAASGSVVEIGHMYCDDIGCYGFRRVTADESGNWIADFANVGEDDDEQDIFDIEPGRQDEARQFDEDGDMTNVQWRALMPSFDAWYLEGNINAYDWPLGATLTLDIEDTTTLNSPDYSTTTLVDVMPWNPLQTLGEFILNGAFIIEPGMTLTISGDSITRELVISNLTVTNADPVTDTVTGGAGPSQDLWMYYGNSSGDCCRDLQANSSGIWTLDYSVPVAGEPVEDLVPDSSGTINAPDEDGDNTSVSWRIPNPTFSSRLTENEVHGYGWTVGDTVTLTIDDPADGTGDVDYTATETVVVSDWDPEQTFAQFRLWEDSFVLAPDQIVTMTDGGITKTHTVTALTVTEVDPDADTISGTAVPGSVVEIGHIHCDETGCYGFRRVTADEGGNWIADFANVGEDDDEQDIFDIEPGTENEARQFDEDGDTTNVQWRVANPNIEARTNEDSVAGYDWILGSTVTVEIDDPSVAGTPDYTTTVVVEDPDWDTRTWFAVAFANEYDLKPGDIVSVTDWSTTKELVVTSLTITGVNPETDVVTGTAEPGSLVYMWTCDESSCYNRQETADSEGLWTTDYGEAELDQDTYDIVPGTWVDSGQRDDDDDDTLFSVTVPNPRLEARASDDQVEGFEWELDTSVTLQINGGILPEGYTDTLTVEVASWDASQTHVVFQFGDQYDLQPGDVVSLSDGTITKTHTVTSLALTATDVETNVVTGTAEPGSEVWINVCWEDGCIDNPPTTANASGVWTTTFTYDIVVGTWVDSGQWDEDSDATRFGIEAFTPTAVTLVEPTGSVYFNQPTYSWDPDIHATQYYLWVNGPSGNVIRILYTPAEAHCTGAEALCWVTPGTTLSGGAYQWWVQISTSAGPGPWSSRMDFTVSPPQAATVTGPTGSITDTTPDYTWNAVDGATWYYLYVNGPSGNVIKQWFDASVICSSGICTATPTTVLSTGTHKWWVQSWSPVGYGAWSAEMTFTPPAPILPGKATLTNPTGNVFTKTPTYTWDEASDTTWYYLYVNGPSGNVIKQWYDAAAICSEGTCSVTPTTTLSAGAHKWWVQTWGPTGYGLWSDTMDFTVAVPGKAILSDPTGSITDTTPGYTWGAVEGATWYYLYVNGPSGNVIKQWYDAAAVCSGGTCAVTPTTTLGSGAHKWWVQSWSPVGYGLWSDQMDFTLP